MVKIEQFKTASFKGGVSRFFAGALGVLTTVPVSVWRNIGLFFLLLWACHSLALLFWQVFPQPALAQPSKLAPLPLSLNPASGQSGVNVNAIVALSLFGKADQAPKATETQASKAPPQPITNNDEDIEETKLNLKLHAIVSSSSDKAARAIIASGSSQELYRIDEEIINKVTLSRILPGRVIISNRGKSESLWLYKEDDSELDTRRTEINTPSNANSDTAVNNFKLNNSETSRTQKGAVTVPAPNQGPSNRSATAASSADRDVKKVVLPRAQVASTKSLSDVLRFGLHRKDGELIGIRLRPGRDRTLFDQSGLKTGDVVTAANGIALDDLVNIRNAQQELKKASSADLEVLRGDETLNISISLD